MNSTFSLFIRYFFVCVFGCALFSAAYAQTSEETAAFRALQQGKAVAIMRHALAPGTGDPLEFSLDDCETQRNLSDEGRSQARRIGAMLSANAIDPLQIISSQWCRCRETAELLNLGPVMSATMLNSFFQDRSTADQQTAQLKQSLRKWLEKSDGARILVTHQVNISALTGEFTGSGEIFIITLEDDDVKILHRLPG